MGKHTIQVVYKNSATDGSDYFRIYANTGNPLTGDNFQLMLLSAAACTSLLCLAMAFLLVSRRKRKYQG